MLYFCKIAFHIFILILNHGAIDSVLNAGFQSFVSTIVGR